MPDIEDEGDAEEEENVIHETMFTFEAFQMVRGKACMRRTAVSLTKIITIGSGGRNSRTPRLRGHCCSTSHGTKSLTLRS